MPTDNHKIYYAHSAKDKDGNHLPYSQWQTMQSHADNVGKMAAEFARIFGAADIARYTGQLHDLGKYSEAFKRRLHGGMLPADHSTAGAKIAFELWGKQGNIGKLMAFCIAGHHAGLANGSKEGKNRSTLKERLSLQFGSDIPQLDEIWRQEIQLPEKIPTLLGFNLDKDFSGFSIAFFTRMLYSCLVDADFLDTEAFYSKLENETVLRGDYLDLAALQQRFKQFINDFRRHIAEKPQETEEQKRNAVLNLLRSKILDSATKNAAQEPGLFSLTVPTGGGKTFSSMAFALEHALQHGMRRVIYVIPYTSIIEQNAAEFRKAFGDLGEAAVLEHHSTFDDSKLQGESSKDKLRLASENWDMPIVVSTAVQFFESLFADRSSRCRKLHNIAGSVIILDEAQMLPLNLLRPIMQAIKELARNYHCSILLCTATQPAIHQQHGFYRGFDNVREIAPNPAELFQQLRRTTVTHIGKQNDTDLLDKLIQHPQMLIIVNNRRHARSLYESAVNLEGVFHLTTLMCAKHRSQVLEQIRQKLAMDAPCRVISTSLIECGVDVDFPLVMRSEAGLDSVAQAAGRCNREGKRPSENSHVWIFEPEGWRAPPELGFLSDVMNNIVRRFNHDLLAPEAITDYFSSVYELKGKELDKHGLLDACQNAQRSFDFPFQDIAEQFRMIDRHMLPVIIPFDKEAQQLIEALRCADKVGGLLRKLSPYIVQIPKKSLEVLCKSGKVKFLNQEKFGTQFCSLIDMDLYDEAGLNWEDAWF